MSDPIYIGETITLRATFRANGLPTDPSTVTLKVRDPSGDVEEYTDGAAELTKENTGVFSKTLSPDKAGTWSYVWEGTGAVDAINTNRFVVEATGFEES